MDNKTKDETEVSEVLERALQKIVEEYDPDKVILFGSYAYGEPDLESDLDVLIIKKTDDRPIDRRVTVRTILRPLRLRPAVSPIVVTQDEIDKRLDMGDPFAEELITRGRVLYER